MSRTQRIKIQIEINFCIYSADIYGKLGLTFGAKAQRQREMFLSISVLVV